MDILRNLKVFSVLYQYYSHYLDSVLLYQVSVNVVSTQTSSIYSSANYQGLAKTIILQLIHNSATIMCNDVYMFCKTSTSNSDQVNFKKEGKDIYAGLIFDGA